jgi:large repetitive protein
MKQLVFPIVALAAMFDASSAYGQAIRQNAGFNTQILARNDDDSAPLTPLGFTINFFGKTRSSTYVNNNGNITFDSALATYTPFGLPQTQREIIAPFFADVDTRPSGSKLVTYGQDTVNGHKAFGANYISVGYYNQHDDKLNSFQVVLIDRTDTGAGNFDIEFNYGHIFWETGDASGGVNGYGNVSATVGWSNGTSDPGTSYQAPGSLIPGSFLDNGPNSLMLQSANSKVSNSSAAVPGRQLYHARDGVISPGLSITSTFPPDATVGAAYSTTLLATGANGPFLWTIQPDVLFPPGLAVSPTGVLSGTATVAGTYSFTLSVTATTDDGPLTVSARGAITIDPAVISVTSVCPAPDAAVGQPYSLTFNATGGTAGYMWAVDDPYSLPPGVLLSKGGLLAGVPLVSGTYIFTLRARSNAADNSQPGQLVCHLTVIPASVSLTSGCSMPNGTVGVPYSQALSAAGGIGPYRFQLLGQLPVGLALTPDGSISGTPTAAVSWPFRISATDSQGRATAQDCSITVNSPAFSLSSVCPLPSAVTGSAYSTSLPSTYTWSLSGTLPAGLALSPDGSISGTPMRAGPNRFLLLAFDANGNQAGQVCSLAVTPGSLAVSGCPLPDGNVGSPYTSLLNGQGGSGPYVITTAGTLPSGIQVSVDGQVTGTPTTAGLFPFSVTMQGAGQTFTQACSLNVNPPSLHLGTACPLPQAQLGASYSTSISAAGGTAPYHFDFYGFLPDGLQATADGVLSGTPQAMGGISFLLHVSDAQNRSFTAPCSINVVLPPAPQLQIGALPPAVSPAATNLAISIQLGQGYSQPIQGQVVLNIQPGGDGNQPDPNLRFANGQTAASFTLPAGSTRLSLPVVSTGTVASTVTVALANLSAAGANLNLYPTPQRFVIPASAPVITSACYTSTSTGVTLQLNGYSTTRELVRADITIGALNLQSDLSGIATAYYSDPISVAAGGTFAVTVPVALTTDSQAAPGVVSINVFNTVGPAGNQTVSACQ